MMYSAGKRIGAVFRPEVGWKGGAKICVEAHLCDAAAAGGVGGIALGPGTAISVGSS